MEAAYFATIHFLSLSDLSLQIEGDLYTLRTKELSDRLERCNSLHWKLPKHFRIETGLKTYVAGTYSSDVAMRLSEDILREAKYGSYTISAGSALPMMFPSLAKKMDDVENVIEAVDVVVTDLEKRLDVAYALPPTGGSRR